MSLAGSNTVNRRLSDITHPQELTEQGELDDHLESPIGKLESKLNGFFGEYPSYRDDAGEGTPIVVGMYGDENLGETLSAFAAGRMAAERQERIAKLIDKSTKAIRNVNNRRK